jgi:hypothetical protein
VWDFWSRHPESLHQVTILMSDRGLPQNYRQIHGFGSHTYSFINANNERFLVKFHFKSQQGIANWTNEEAAKVVAADRESAQRDLYANIEKRNFPRWNLRVQSRHWRSMVRRTAGTTASTRTTTASQGHCSAFSTRVSGSGCSQTSRWQCRACPRKLCACRLNISPRPIRPMVKESGVQ